MLVVSSPPEHEVNIHIIAILVVQARVLAHLVENLCGVMGGSMDILVVECFRLALDDIVRNTNAKRATVKSNPIGLTWSLVKSVDVHPHHCTVWPGHCLVMDVVHPMRLLRRVKR